jgi:hypothetical protein
LLVALLAVLAAGVLAATGAAGLFGPQRIDARTGKDAIPLGTAIGNRRAWAGFAQNTGGRDRLYVAFARNGSFGAPFLADRGNEITGGELAGSHGGDAVVVFVEKVGNNHVLFGRRLHEGSAGSVAQISANGEDVKFAGFMFPFDRTWSLAMNARGAAAVTYFHAAGMKAIAATLAPGANQWTSHQLATTCDDPGIDDRGNVACVGVDANNHFAASRIVGGQLRTETIDANSMDEFSLAVGRGGTALALERDKDFHVVAWRKLDIAQDGAWENVGPKVEEGIIQANANAEDPFAALDRRGNGALTFRDNSNNNPQGYYRLVAAGRPGSGGVLYKSMARGRIRVDGAGNAVVAFTAGAAQTVHASVRRFARGLPGAESPLARGLEPYSIDSSVGIDVDDAGNLIALITQGANPTTVRAIFGDFAGPTLKPRASSSHPRVGRKIKLYSGASDSFADIRARDVRWTLPSGVSASRTVKGLNIRVRFNSARRFKIRVKAVDRAGNHTSATLRVRVR